MLLQKVCTSRPEGWPPKGKVFGAERGQVAARSQMARSWIALGSAAAKAAARAREGLADSARMGLRGAIFHEFRGQGGGAQPYPQPFEK